MERVISGNGTTLAERLHSCCRTALLCCTRCPSPSTPCPQVHGHHTAALLLLLVLVLILVVVLVLLLVCQLGELRF